MYIASQTLGTAISAEIVFQYASIVLIVKQR
jgi:hypothetical protein